jgi:hypothetical protein
MGEAMGVPRRMQRVAALSASVGGSRMAISSKPASCGSGRLYGPDQE